MCSKKGLQCNADDKVFGPKRECLEGATEDNNPLGMELSKEISSVNAENVQNVRHSLPTSKVRPLL